MLLAHLDQKNDDRLIRVVNGQKTLATRRGPWRVFRPFRLQRPTWTFRPLPISHRSTPMTTSICAVIAKIHSGRFQRAGRELIPDAILLLDGKRHIKRRGIMSRTLSDSHVAAMREQYLKPTIDMCLREIAASTPKTNGYVSSDLVKLAQRSVHRIAAAVSGVDNVDTSEAVDRLVKLVRRMAAGVQVQFSDSSPPRSSWPMPNRPCANSTRNSSQPLVCADWD